jgi:DNA polymerase
MNAQLAARALAWWNEAGVDTLIGEEPRDWLKPKAAPAPAAAPEAGPAATDLPDTLDTFCAWLRTAALPFPTIGGRVDPAGDPFSGLMVMIDMPAPGGGWFEGEADPLFDRMMAKIGRSRDTIYLASLSPARAPGRPDAAAVRHLADIARHHIGLVAPRALLLFGDLCAHALLGAGVAGTRGRWHALETPAGPVKALATIRPEQLVTGRQLRHVVMEDLQLLMEELRA